jgi:hypothetical protein
MRVQRPTPQPTSRMRFSRRFMMMGVKVFLIALSMTKFLKRVAPGTKIALAPYLDAILSK